MSLKYEPSSKPLHMSLLHKPDGGMVGAYLQRSGLFSVQRHPRPSFLEKKSRTVLDVFPGGSVSRSASQLSSRAGGYRVTSLIRNSNPPSDHHRALGIVLLKRCIMAEDVTLKVSRSLLPQPSTHFPNPNPATRYPEIEIRKRNA